MGKKRKGWTHGEYVRVLHYLQPEFKEALATFRARWLVPPEVDDDPTLNPHKAAVPELFESVLLPEEIASLEAVPFFTSARGVVQLYATMFDKKGEEFCYWHLWKAVASPLVASPLVGPPPAGGRYVQPEIRDEGDRDRFNVVPLYTNKLGSRGEEFCYLWLWKAVASPQLGCRALFRARKYSEPEIHETPEVRGRFDALVARVDRLHGIILAWLGEREARKEKKRGEADTLRCLFPRFPLRLAESAAMPDLGEVTERGKIISPSPVYNPKQPWKKSRNRGPNYGRFITILRLWNVPSDELTERMGVGPTTRDYQRLLQWRTRAKENLKRLAPVVPPVKHAT